MIKFVYMFSKSLEIRIIMYE